MHRLRLPVSMLQQLSLRALHSLVLPDVFREVGASTVAPLQMNICYALQNNALGGTGIP